TTGSETGTLAASNYTITRNPGTLTVTKASSSVATVIYVGSTSTPVSGAQPLGTSVYDTATVSGAGPTPTGTVVYTFYPSLDGTGTAISTQTVTLTSTGGVPDSSQMANLHHGSYSYVAVYSGDS